MRRFALLLLFFLLFSLSGCTPAKPTPPEDTGTTRLSRLETVVFSIGKADAILIHNQGGAVLIDAGETEDAEEILAYLRAARITRLDALILTHYDRDHVGGAAGILRGVEVGAVYGTYPVKESTEYQDYTAALAERGLTPTIVRVDCPLTFGEIHMTIYPPEETHYKKDESNNSSLAVHMTYGKTSFLFAGDAQEARLAELTARGAALHCDFLKVPYHGNDIDGFPAFLAAVRPTYAAITCSQKNPETATKTAALTAAGAKVYLSRNGNIYAESDGVTVSVRQ